MYFNFGCTSLNKFIFIFRLRLSVWDLLFTNILKCPLHSPMTAFDWPATGQSARGNDENRLPRAPPPYYSDFWCRVAVICKHHTFGVMRQLAHMKNLSTLGGSMTYLSKLSPWPSWPCSPWPQLHTSVCREGSTSRSAGAAIPDDVKAAASIFERPPLRSSRGDTAGVQKQTSVMT